MIPFIFSSLDLGYHKTNKYDETCNYKMKSEAVKE